MPMLHPPRFFQFLLSLIILLPSIAAAGSDTITVTTGLLLPVPRSTADVIVSRNPVESAMVLGSWTTPAEGDDVLFPGDIRSRWRKIAADEHGWFTDSALAGCYVLAKVECEKSATMILEAFGDEMVWVNGSPRTGNPYGLKDTYESWEPRFDYSRLPVGLHSGVNEFLFRSVRGALKARLCRPRKGVFLNANDCTLPDCLVGEPLSAPGGIVVVNATDGMRNSLSVRTSVDGGTPQTRSVPVIQPMSVRKIVCDFAIPARADKGTVPVRISLLNGERVMDSVTVLLRCVAGNENHKETFISAIDGSVQYYGILPASGNQKNSALVLSLHGASVEAINQSGSYEQKTWCSIVAPTNRRPYGFNWEEWGRMDALEVLNLVKEKYSVDESRIYLTGHSMGGHGTWHIGSLYPDQFAAIGPSAGWISFWTYRFRGINLGDTSDVRAMIRRSTTPSETFQYVPNYNQLGVYVLHGSDDDNVPVDEARSMVEQLKKEHRDFIYHEEPGVGHWWDKSDEPGADCVDWAPMFDFFAKHARPLPGQMRQIRFRTSNPGVSSTDGWVSIVSQKKQLAMSSVDIRFDPGLHRFTATTGNIARLRIDHRVLSGFDTVTVMIDSQKVLCTRGSSDRENDMELVNNGAWMYVSPAAPLAKNPLRYGTLKEAFRNRMVLVYGTRGSTPENQWAFDKARFDAEKLWYQGNGSVDVVADVDFNPSADPQRNVILYGNNKTNASWSALLGKSPVQAGEGWVKIGGRKFTGDDFSCIFVRPREGSATAIVGAISGSGASGMRISNRLPYLSPGIGLPDCTLMSSKVCTLGDAGVIAAGFFGIDDWGVESGDFVWNDK